MSPSVAVSIMRYAANNGTSAAREKYGSVMYNNALGQAKAKGATGDMIRKSLQSIAKKSSDAAKNIPKAVRDMMLPKGTTSVPKKPGADIPKRVKKMMVSAEQDAQNKKDAKLKTTDKRPKVTKGGVEKMVKDATSKAESAAKTASRVGKLAKGVTGVGALLTASEAGAGSDVVPAGRRDEFVKKMDAERKAKEKAQGRGRGDGAKETATRRALQEDKKRVDAATKANKTDEARPKTYKIKKGDTLSEIAQKHGLKTDALAKKNDIADKNKIYAGRTLKLNKGGAANCGASMAPTQVSTKRIK